jgi:hypothetical protein
MFKAWEGVSYPSYRKRLALIDRLVELGYIVEVTKPGEVSGQDRVFVGGPPLHPNQT